MLKPRMRGWLHAGVFPLALAGGVWLVAAAHSAAAVAACSVYALSACLLFGTSALYHRGRWGPRGEAVLRRLDHANTFLIIAGTYTPLAVLLLPAGRQQILLSLVWCGAAAGIAFRVFWIGAPRRLYTLCYVSLGWAAVFYLPAFADAGGAMVVALVIAGGLLYTAGAAVYGLKRPDPWLVRIPRGLPHAHHRRVRRALRSRLPGGCLIRRLPGLQKSAKTTRPDTEGSVAAG